MPPTLFFTSAEKVDIRRYCGFYLFGSQPIQTFGWRFTTQYGHLEFIMNNMSDDEITVARTVYLPNLRLLETDIPGTRQNLDTWQAAVWYWNQREIDDRMKLYKTWCKEFAGFMGVGMGPNLSSGITFSV